VRAGEQDLRALAAIVSQDRRDQPVGKGTDRCRSARPRWHRSGSDRSVGQQGGRQQASIQPPRLTPRQNDLMRLLAAGCTNTQIARRLGISEGTVRTHLENIYERLGVSSRTAAVIRAFPEPAA